jgi:hypothetical protein
MSTEAAHHGQLSGYGRTVPRHTLSMVRDPSCGKGSSEPNRICVSPCGGKQYSPPQYHSQCHSLLLRPTN